MSKLKTVRITYFENPSSKKWMNKNLRPQAQSGFIRDAVKLKIGLLKPSAIKHG